MVNSPMPPAVASIHGEMPPSTQTGTRSGRLPQYGSCRDAIVLPYQATTYKYSRDQSVMGNCSVVNRSDVPYPVMRQAQERFSIPATLGTEMHV